MDEADLPAFVETEAFKACLEFVETRGVCFITGRPGTGKTALGLELLRRHRDQMRPVKLQSLEGSKVLLPHLSKDRPFLVFLDGVFDGFSAEPTASSARYIHHLWTGIKSSCLKVLISFRKDSFQKAKQDFGHLDLFKCECEINLTKMCPSDKEKVSIFRNMLIATNFLPHVRPYNLKKAASQTGAYGFPYCCKLYFSTTDEVPLEKYICKEKFEMNKLKNFVGDVLSWTKNIRETLNLTGLDDLVRDPEEPRKEWDATLDVGDNTILHFIVDQGKEDSLETALDRGDAADVINEKNSAGQTALHLAVQKKLPRMVELLLKHGCDPSVLDSADRSATHYAASQDSTLMMKTLISNGGLSRIAADKDGVTPLHVAVSNNAEDIVQLLLEAGDDVNAADGDVLERRGVADMIKTQNSAGQTALHLAVQKKLPQTVALLLKHDSDPALLDCESRTASHYAACQDGPQMMETLIHHGGLCLTASDKDGVTPLHVAASSNTEDIARLLLEAGDDVNAEDKEGSTFLHHAARAGAGDVLGAVVDWSAVILDHRNKAGKTALADSVWIHSKVTEILLDHNADGTAMDTEGNTPLMSAIDAGNSETAMLLLEREPGAALLKNNKGDLPVQAALRKRMPDVARALLERHLDTETVDADRNTLLMLAVSSEDPSLVQWMLENTDCVLTLDKQNKKGATAMTLAEALTDKSIRDLLGPLYQ